MTTLSRDDMNSLPDFRITDPSRELLKSIEDSLFELVSRDDLHPSDDEFYSRYMAFLDLYDRFQNMLVIDSGIDIVCSAGCSNCCCHWVDDVNSFEGIIIKRYISDNYPEIVEHVIKRCREDAEQLNCLRVLVDEKADEYSSDPDELPDKYELLLSCFYQLERPCALLDDEGRCIIYPVRPLTCRDFLNIRDPHACLPDRINDEKEATLILYLSDIVSDRIEMLHRRFDNDNDNMSLRSILIHFSESGTESPQ